MSFVDGSLVENGTTIGPFYEGYELTLYCTAAGAKPLPSVNWLNGTSKMKGKSLRVNTLNSGTTKCSLNGAPPRGYSLSLALPKFQSIKQSTK